MPPRFTSPFYRPLLWFAALALTLALGVAVWANASGGVPQRSDFTMLYASAQSYREGGSLYRQYLYTPFMHRITFADQTAVGEIAERKVANLNPPITTLFLLPFTGFEFRTAYYLWCALQLALALYAMMRLTRHFLPTHPLIRPLGLLALVGYFPTFANLLIGQLGLFLFAIMAGAALALSRRQATRLGLWLGLALTLKMFIGLIFVWLLLCRQWRTLFTGAAVYLAFMAVGLLMFGLHDHQRWLLALADYDWMALSWNGALAGELARTLGGGANITYVDWPWARFAITTAAIVATGVLLIWMGRRVPPAANIRRGFIVCLPLMLFLSPLGWIYYFPLLPLAFIMLAAEGHMKLAGLAVALGGVPQFLGVQDFYHPRLWHPHYYGLIPPTPGLMEKGGYLGVHHWFIAPEVYPLALLLMTLAAFLAYKRSSSTHTGA